VPARSAQRLESERYGHGGVRRANSGPGSSSGGARGPAAEVVGPREALSSRAAEVAAGGAASGAGRRPAAGGWRFGVKLKR
jgi:hypothetical protein